MICHFRSDGTIVFANDACARAVGAAAGKLKGKNFWKVVDRDESGRFASALALLSPAAPETSVESQLETKDGSRVILWKSYAIKFDDAGVGKSSK